MAPSNRDLVAAVLTKVHEGMRARYDPKAGPVLSLGLRQRQSRVDRGPSSSVWTSQATIPTPSENDARDAVLAAVDSLGSSGILPPLQASSVSLEWVAVRRGKPVESGDLSPKDRYALLTQEAVSPATTIFVHGGAFFQNGFGTSRPNATKLSHHSGGRVVVLDYRLAPQHPFPAAILDLFILYLSLLSPPPGSVHSPVPASSIVIAGESTGANISMAFIQVLLQIRSTRQHLTFNGQQVCLPMPAGVTTLSCLGDQGLCLPSWTTNKQYDIYAEQAPFLQSDFPPDDTWPSNPPRADVYCDASNIFHPLVSPCLAESWKGAPPMWFGVGQERMADSVMLMAQTAARSSVCVELDQYEGMPHCWPFLMPKFPHSVHVWERWGRACREMAESKVTKSQAKWIELESLKEREVDVRNLTNLSIGEARAMIEAKTKTMKVYTGRKDSSRL